MSHDPSRHSLFLIIWSKINLSLSLHHPEFYFLFTNNQPTFFHLISLLLPTNPPPFPHPTLHKLSFLITLQCLTRHSSVTATRLFIHIAHHPTRDDGMATMRPSIYIAHHPTRDGSVAAIRRSIHIGHHSLSFVYSSWTLNVAS